MCEILLKLEVKIEVNEVNERLPNLYTLSKNNTIVVQTYDGMLALQALVNRLQDSPIHSRET